MRTYVVPGKVVDLSLRKHRVVCTNINTWLNVCRSLENHRLTLEFALAERRGIASNDNKLGLAGSESLESRLVSQDN